MPFPYSSFLLSSLHSLVIKPSDPPTPTPPLLSLSYILSPLYPSLISYYNYMNVKMKSNPNFQILKRKPHKANHKGKLTKFQTVPAHSDFAKSFPHSHAHHYTHTHTQYNTNLIINIVVSVSTDLIHNAT